MAMVLHVVILGVLLLEIIARGIRDQGGGPA